MGTTREITVGEKAVDEIQEVGRKIESLRRKLCMPTMRESLESDAGLIHCDSIRAWAHDAVSLLVRYEMDLHRLNENTGKTNEL